MKHPFLRFLSVFLLLTLPFRGAVTVSSDVDTFLKSQSKVGGRAALNLTPSTAAGIIYVSKSSTATDTRSPGSGSDLTATDPAAPFATIGAALTAAVALSPTVTAPVLISVGPGNFTEGALSLSTPYISISGAGIQSTVISESSTNALTISAAHVRVANLSVIRAASGNAAKVFHCSVADLATWLDDIVLENVRISNPNGTAVGTMTAETFGLIVNNSITGIDWNYGGQHHRGTFVGTQYAIYESQSCAHQYGYGPANVHEASFEGCYISSTDVTGGIAIYGLVESAYGTRTGTDIGTGTDNHVITRGLADVSWYPTRIKSSRILGAAVLDPGTPATSECLRGTFYVDSTTVYGDVITTHIHNGYASGGVWTSQRTNTTAFIKNADNYTWTGTAFVFGGTTALGGQMSAKHHTLYSSCQFENNATLYTSAIQNNMFSCADLIWGPLGWQRKDLALRFIGNPLCFAQLSAPSAVAIASFEATSPAAINTTLPHRLATGSIVTLAITGGSFSGTINGAQTVTVTSSTRFTVNGINCSSTSGATGTTTIGSNWNYISGDYFTVECWFRSSVRTAAYVGFVTSDNSTTKGWALYGTPSAGASGGIVARLSGTDITYANSGCYDGAWHHIAFTISGSTRTLWVDGFSRATNGSPVSDTGVANKRMLIGCYGTNPLNDTSGDTGAGLDGDIRQVRISQSATDASAARYSAGFVPRKRFTSDTATIALFNETTTPPVESAGTRTPYWEDKAGLQDAKLLSDTLYAYWISENYTAP